MRHKKVKDRDRIEASSEWGFQVMDEITEHVSEREKNDRRRGRELEECPES